MDIIKILQEELGIRRGQVETTIKLIDEGNTIPFIARYRKEMTGSLDDETLRNFHERLLYLRNLEDRKEAIKKNIEEQGKLTKELAKQIEEAKTLVAVEDLYRPYKQKKRTRAMIAKEKGLEPLANLILLQMTNEPLEKEAKAFINEEKDVKTVEDALKGANDIIAEHIADDAEYRTWIRKATWDHGKITSTAKKPDESSVFEMYYDFEEPIKKIAGYRILAINRGEKEGILQVKIEPDMQKIASYLARKIVTKKNPNTTKALFAAIEDSYKRLIAPSIERDIRNELTENASTEAIKVFGKNLTQLLMQPPIAGQVVLGWDPAFRTGCKLAVVDETGKVLDTVVVYPTAPQNKVEEAKKVVKGLIKKYGITLISIGNGTASRESEQIVVDMLKEIKEPVQYVITNEAGASVYSASKLATEEFPNFDVGQRSATSIARRVQDPLAELVKIEPKAIGVGQYQHAAGQAVHQILAGGFHDNVPHKVAGQGAAFGQAVGKFMQLLFIGQIAKQQQVGNFLKAIALAAQTTDQVIHVIPAVPQLAIAGGFNAVTHFKRINAGNIGNPGQHTVAVLITQAALYTELIKQIRINGIVMHTQFCKQLGFFFDCRILTHGLSSFYF